jgi:hypothetical protein
LFILKIGEMKTNTRIEVILCRKVSLADPDQRELEKWMSRIGLPAICRQEKKAKKFFSDSLKDSPGIYMS